MYMLFEADAVFIFISSVSISYIPWITVNYLPSSDRHQQPIRIAGSSHTESSSCQTHSKNKICY